MRVEGLVSREPLTRLLKQLRRLRVDADEAFTYLVAVLKEAPPAVAVRLPDAQRRQVLADGSVTEDDLRSAEESIANGDFIVDLLGQALLGLISSLTEDDLRDLLEIDQRALDSYYADGRLIGRSSARGTATPGWLVDLSQPDRLIPSSREVLTADAPSYVVSFGQAIYLPQQALRARAALSPRTWLSEALDPATVVSLIVADS